MHGSLMRGLERTAGALAMESLLQVDFRIHRFMHYLRTHTTHIHKCVHTLLYSGTLFNPLALALNFPPKVGAHDPNDEGESFCSYLGAEIGGPFLAPLPRKLCLDLSRHRAPLHCVF